MTPEELQQQIMNAIAAYNRRRAEILQRAMSDGGAELAEQLEREYDALRDAYFQLVRVELDQNNHQYDQLTRNAAATAAAIEQSVESQASTVQLLNTITGVINILGRALIVLGL